MKEVIRLKTSDIVDVYIISLIYDKSSEQGFLDFCLEEIKQEYLSAFRKLMIRQFHKYSSTNRVYGLSESDISKVKSDLELCSLNKFPTIFSLTLRGDRLRENERWVTIAENLLRVEQAQGKGIIQAIDLINTTVHNSRDSVLTKFDNALDIYRTLNNKKLMSPKKLVSYSSREIRQIAERVLQ
jgi:hypothetical protein